MNPLDAHRSSSPVLENIPPPNAPTTPHRLEQMDRIRELFGSEVCRIIQPGTIAKLPEFTAMQLRSVVKPSGVSTITPDLLQGNAAVWFCSSESEDLNPYAGIAIHCRIAEENKPPYDCVESFVIRPDGSLRITEFTIEADGNRHRSPLFDLCELQDFGELLKGQTIKMQPSSRAPIKIKMVQKHL